MEEIKSSVDKIFEQFTADSVSYAFPKRLSYTYANDSPASVAKKRKLSVERDISNNTSLNNNASIDKNVSQDSLNNSNASTVSSPWQIRRMRADIIDYNARAIQMRNELDKRTLVQKEMETMYAEKVNALQKQLDHSLNKNGDCEKHLRNIRKRESSEKEELVKTKNLLTQQKHQYDELVHSLQRANSELEDNLQDTKYQLTCANEELTRELTTMNSNYELTKKELESQKSLMESIKEESKKCRDKLMNEEIEKNALENAERKIKDLENEILAFGEWKELSKTFQNRLFKLPELEKEVERLKRDNKSLQENIGNKLLMEEEVFDLKTRLEKTDKNNEELVSLKTKLKSLEQELNDYKTIAIDHCLPGTLITPISLRSRFEDILHKDVILTNEKNAANTEKGSISNQIQELKKENDIYTKANSDFQTSLKYHKTSLYRVQKKLSLVAKERDCYKQLIENYEKDLTINGVAADMNPDSQMRLRLDMLEKTVAGYKDMCSILEKELQTAKALPDLSLDSPVNSEHYEKLRKELENIRQENDRLRRRKEELELTLEHSSLKGAFNMDKFKVVHMAANPSDEAYGKHKTELEKLQAEIERLRRKNRNLEEVQEEMTVRLNETNNITMEIKELGNLRSQLKNLENKNQHLKEIYKAASQEFREVCYMLFGFKVDRIGSTNYRISSMYADSEDDYLNFRLNESGVLDMLETDYSSSLTDMIGTHLVEHNSLPLFLCTLTLELFNKTTMV